MNSGPCTGSGLVKAGRVTTPGWLCRSWPCRGNRRLGLPKHINGENTPDSEQGQEPLGYCLMQGSCFCFLLVSNLLSSNTGKGKDITRTSRNCISASLPCLGTNNLPLRRVNLPGNQSVTFKESAKDYGSNFWSMRRWPPQTAASEPGRIVENNQEYLLKGGFLILK